jgi:hypothetical protein
VSRSSPEHLRIGLGSKWLSLAGYGRDRGKLLRKQIVLIEPAPEAAPWQAAIDALPAALANVGAAPVTVILSNHFVRYALLPWSANVKSGAEWLALARHRFAAIHGACAEQWTVRISETGPRAPHIASAVDSALLEALLARLAASGAKLVSVQPYLMAAFNRIRRSLDDASCWLVIEEPGRVALALIRNGVWTAIRARRKDERWRETLPAILERESAILGLEEPCTEAVVHTHVAFEEDVQGSLRLRDVTLGEGSIPSDRELAMALG